MGVYRPYFIEAVSSLIPPSAAHFNKRCTKVESLASTGQNVLHFTDGSTHTVDLVIGADGIKSVIRDAVMGNSEAKACGETNMVFTNTVAYRGMILKEDLIEAGVKTVMDDRPLCWMGKNHVCYGLLPWACSR